MHRTTDQQMQADRVPIPTHLCRLSHVTNWRHAEQITPRQWRLCHAHNDVMITSLLIRSHGRQVFRGHAYNLSLKQVATIFMTCQGNCANPSAWRKSNVFTVTITTTEVISDIRIPCRPRPSSAAICKNCNPCKISLGFKAQIKNLVPDTSSSTTIGLL